MIDVSSEWVAKWVDVLSDRAMNLESVANRRSSHFLSLHAALCESCC